MYKLITNHGGKPGLNHTQAMLHKIEERKRKKIREFYIKGAKLNTNTVLTVSFRCIFLWSMCGKFLSHQYITYRVMVLLFLHLQ